jgi:hypothetical protein
MMLFKNTTVVGTLATGALFGFVLTAPGCADDDHSHRRVERVDYPSPVVVTEPGYYYDDPHYTAPPASSSAMTPAARPVVNVT